ncbi:MAG: hypothetical protein CL928_10130 [Deltaproteobacteria bacterium]|nr:hypothetical protein [Deltaproteobacteria bacterium]
MIERILLLTAIVLLTPGCYNDCQKLCAEMADYWSDCDLSFGDAEVADCRKSFRKNNKADDEDLSLFDRYRGACRQLISMSEDDDGTRMIALRAQFTCDDMSNGPGGAFGAAGDDDDNDGGDGGGD